MNFDKRSLAAIVLCVVFYLAYTAYLSKRYPDARRAGQTQTETLPQTGDPTSAGTTQTPAAGTVTGTAAATAATEAAAPIARLADADLTISGDKVTYVFSQDAGGLASVKLGDFRASRERDSAPVELLDSPLVIQGVPGVALTPQTAVQWHAERTGRSIRFWRDEGALRIAHTYTVPESGYGGTLQLSFQNNGQQPLDLTGGIQITSSIRPKKSENLVGFLPGVVTEQDHLLYRADNSTTQTLIEEFCKDDEVVQHQGVPLAYFGLDRHYFMMAVLPKAANGNLRITHQPPTQGGCQITILSYDKLGFVPAGGTVTLDYATYFGPKDLQPLRAHSPALESSVQMGIFGFLAQPLLMAIDTLKSLSGNWGVAIILMTCLLKILFYPLVRASYVSMHKMKKLNPEMTAIREKFKNDRQRQQQELMAFMVKNKINPMKGCLPILPQIPVFFAFYQVLQTSIQLRHAPFFGWIADLSAMDPYFVTPLLMGVAMFIQQKLTPTTGMDKTQEKILMFMPVMFTFMMLTLPAGLTLYMLTNTVVGIAQQRWLYSRLDKAAA